MAIRAIASQITFMTWWKKANDNREQWGLSPLLYGEARDTFAAVKEQEVIEAVPEYKPNSL